MVAVDYFIPALILIFGSLAILMIKLMHILCNLLIFIQCYSILLSRLHEKFVSGNLVLIIRVPGIFCTIIYHKSLSVVRVFIFCFRTFQFVGRNVSCRKRSKKSKRYRLNKCIHSHYYECHWQHIRRTLLYFPQYSYFDFHNRILSSC